MYALLKYTGDGRDLDVTVVAVSDSVDVLREELRKNARHVISIYFEDSRNDDYEREMKKELLRSLDEFKEGNSWVWSDGSEQDPLSYEIVKAPFIGRKRKPVTVKMAFGTETVCKLEDAESKKDIQRIVKEGNVVVRRFRTEGERLAYFQGCNDVDGWNKWGQVSDVTRRGLSRFVPDEPTD